MENYKVSYIHDQISKTAVDFFVVDGQINMIVEGEELVPIMMEDVLFLEYRRDGKVVSFINFWKVDEVHYVGTE